MPNPFPGNYRYSAAPSESRSHTNKYHVHTLQKADLISYKQQIQQPNNAAVSSTTFE
jgi:hypothetical protein